MDLEQTTPTDVETMKSKLKNVQRRQEIEDSTTAFAFEDDEGHLVKVYVAKDQAEQFKKDLGAMLDDAENEDLEISEAIYRLHQKYDIVNVEWCEGAIPEDEEVANPQDPIQNNTDAEQKGFPDTNEPQDVTAVDQGTPDSNSEDPTMAADAGTEEVDVNAEVSKMQMLDKVLSLLQARTDADRAKADAEKAKADVEASRVAAQAAAQYAASQEEVMDMENYNKRAQEEKRESSVQSKLIRYRHDLRKQSTETLDDKLKDPQFLLNMLAKAQNGKSIGESMTMNITPPTPEEEELLHMEDWEEKKAEEEKHNKIRERLMKYRHARRKEAAPTTEAAETPATEEAPEVDVKSIADLKNARFLDYLKANSFATLSKHIKANS